MTVILIFEVLQAQDLDSSVAEFILLRAEVRLRNDMGSFEWDSKWAR